MAITAEREGQTLQRMAIIGVRRQEDQTADFGPFSNALLLDWLTFVMVPPASFVSFASCFV